MSLCRPLNQDTYQAKSRDCTFKWCEKYLNERMFVNDGRRSFMTNENHGQKSLGCSGKKIIIAGGFMNDSFWTARERSRTICSKTVAQE